jgi:tetratricopeptide (TPR) repeat protein
VLDGGDEIGAGTKIGDVVLERELGSGAYGVVYRGRDTLLDRPVAMKVLRSQGIFASAKDRKRFLAEAKVVASLASPNVVTLFHVHDLGGEQWALELELVEGGTLADLLGENLRLPSETVVRMGKQLSTGLAVAHASGVVHGDVKPENVLLARDGTPKLADFGLARVVGEHALEHTSMSRGVGGTPLYMAPEVILGEGHVPASDVWSLGVVLYRMLTGRLPFEGETLYALFLAVQNRPPASLGPDVPVGLVDIVLRCLRKRPEERPDAGVELNDLLAHALDAQARATKVVPARAVPVASNLAGRQDEVARIVEAMRHVVGGHGTTVVVTGPTGIGKSALLHAVMAHAESLGFHWVQTAVSVSEGLLRPLLDAARVTLVGRGAGAAPPNLTALAPSLQGLLGAEGSPRLESRQQAVWVIQQFLTALAEQGPVALVIEGMHNAEPAELSILRDLAQRVSESRILLIVSSRTGERGGFGSSGLLTPLADLDHVVRVELAALPSEALYALIEGALGVRIAADVAERVLRGAEGNPLFALELVRHLEVSGAAARVDGELRWKGRVRGETLPTRLVDLLSGRLRKLPASTRNLLDVAAVDGVAFDGEALAAVSKRELLSVLRVLQKLSRDEGIVQPRDRGYRFARTLLRDVLYSEVAPELRRELHRRLAEHLESREEPVDPERLGVHWEAAGDVQRAKPYLRDAALRAVQRAENARAVDLSRRAGLVPGKILPNDARAATELLMHLARTYVTLGQSAEDVEAIYDVLCRVADEDRDARLRMRVAARRGHFRYFGRGWKPSDEEDVRNAAASLPISQDLGRARYLLGIVAKFRGDLEDATRWLQAADDAFRVVPDSDVHRASVLDQLASVALRAGRAQEAESLYEQASALSARTGWLVNAAASDVNRVVAAFSRGIVEGHEQRLERSIHRLRLEQSHGLAAHAMVVSAQVRTALGDLEGASKTLAEALAILGSSSLLPAVAAIETERGYVEAVRGNLDVADLALSRAVQAAEGHGDVLAQGMAWAYRALVACFASDGASAATAARRAIECTRVARGTSSAGPVLLALFEATLYGLDKYVALDALRVLGIPSGGDGPPSMKAAADWGAALGAERGSTAELRSLQRLSDALRRGEEGSRRAVLRATGALIAATVAGRRDGVTAATRHAKEAALEAKSIGHVWLEARAWTFLAPLLPEPERREALGRIETLGVRSPAP